LRILISKRIKVLWVEWCKWIRARLEIVSLEVRWMIIVREIRSPAGPVVWTVVRNDGAEREKRD
jgi:hypothetical protein